jgi:FkbM family methyltransferase
LSKSYNHLTNLKVFKLAAGDTIGNSEMASPSPVSFNKGLGSLNQNLDIERTYKPERVDVVTLDSHYCEKRRVSLVKIDTQGFELNVLRGATNTINEHRPVVIFEHEDQYHSDAKEVRESIGDFFERAEYDLYAPGRHFLTRLAFCGVPHLHGDVIALPRK